METLKLHVYVSIFTFRLCHFDNLFRREKKLFHILFRIQKKHKKGFFGFFLRVKYKWPYVKSDSLKNYVLNSPKNICAH